MLMEPKGLPVPEAPPPSYDSLVAAEAQHVDSTQTETPTEPNGQVAEPETAKEKKELTLLRCCKKTGIALGIIFGIVFCCGLGVALPIVEIYFGTIHKSECPHQKFIPIYLIVSGSATFIAISGGSGSSAKKKASDDDSILSGDCCAVTLVIIFLICWLICGSVWVFETRECDSSLGIIGPKCFTTNATMPYSESYLIRRLFGNYPYNYCHPFLYKLTYWDIIAKWILIAVTTVVGLLIACASCISDHFKEEEEAEESNSNPQPAVALTSMSAIPT